MTPRRRVRARAASGVQRGRIHSATPMNGTYDAALTTKHAIAPTLDISTPAIDGPRMRERLNCVELSARPRADLLARDDRRHDRLKRRHRERVGDADHHRERDDHPRLEPAGDQQHDDRGRAQHLDRLEQRDHAPAIGAIGERAADQRQQPHRRVHRERVEPDQERRRAEGEQQPRLRDLLGPGADAREQAGEPERAEAPRREQAKRVAERLGRRGTRTGCRPRTVPPIHRCRRGGRSPSRAQDTSRGETSAA